MSAAPSTLRLAAKRRFFRADAKTSQFRTRWEVQKPPSPGLETEALWSLRLAARAAEGNLPQGGEVVAPGLRATTRAVDEGKAWVVFVCCEDVPSVLIQHLPVLCQLRATPVAVLAASPMQLAGALAPLLGKEVQQVVAAALLRDACKLQPRLSELCEKLATSLPRVRLPFLLPDSGAPRWPPPREELEGVIRLKPQLIPARRGYWSRGRFNSQHQGETHAHSKGKSKGISKSKGKAKWGNAGSKSESKPSTGGHNEELSPPLQSKQKSQADTANRHQQPDRIQQTPGAVSKEQGHHELLPARQQPVPAQDSQAIEEDSALAQHKNAGIGQPVVSSPAALVQLQAQQHPTQPQSQPKSQAQVKSALQEQHSAKAEEATVVEAGAKASATGAAPASGGAVKKRRKSSGGTRESKSQIPAFPTPTGLQRKSFDFFEA
eukprot:TRINITY_DN94130_c0_g1_i1.p1 TRINITY_DN94130_c0_g1~~TRINITY_DN94130_c0_g1_i1.p1  ORF type:complete len:448 (-),score=80.96 TRINITY_DN94130_c0_g1_i1:48-1352(-)